MSSQRRIDASRANGALSHGPKTPEGRALSDAARLTHGLTSRRTLVGNESEEDFRALRETYTAYFLPVTRFIAARWRLIRITSIETAMLNLEMDRQEPHVKKEFEICDAATRVAMAFRALSDDSRALALLNRYESRFRRICDKLLRVLETCRANRKLRQEPSPINEQCASTA